VQEVKGADLVKARDAQPDQFPGRQSRRTVRRREPQKCWARPELVLRGSKDLFVRSGRGAYPNFRYTWNISPDDIEGPIPC